MESISVVIPVYGCPGALEPLCDRLIATLEKLTDRYEIILVNDGCPRGSWDYVEKMTMKYPAVIGVELSRNFGQIKAITAGLDCSGGDWVVVMDCDLQDRPEAIADLYHKAVEGGYDVLFAQRSARKDTGLVKLFSKLFYKVYNYFTDGNYDGALCNFSISRRRVVDSYCSMRERNRSFSLFIKWLGFRQSSMEIEGDARYEGKSSYNFRKKIKMAVEIITSQSNKPLMTTVRLGFIMAVCAAFFLVFLVIRLFVMDITPGWTSILGSIYFVGGLIISTVGMVGIYVGNIFDEVKRRPVYVVRSVLNEGALLKAKPGADSTQDKTQDKTRDTE